jgi:hypothetical protein
LSCHATPGGATEQYYHASRGGVTAFFMLETSSNVAHVVTPIHVARQRYLKGRSKKKLKRLLLNKKELKNKALSKREWLQFLKKKEREWLQNLFFKRTVKALP